MMDAEQKPWTKSKHRPSWMVSIYERPAWDVSPFIVDIESAYLGNKIDIVMAMSNFLRTGIHVSFIDTKLSAMELADHLRQFGYVVDEARGELTLRLADGIAIPWIQEVMSPEQWAAIHKPIRRWRFHSRDGRLVELPAPEDVEPVDTPLKFSAHQIAALEKSHEPDHLMSNLRAMRNDHLWAPTPQLEIELAAKILKIWRDSGQVDSSTLLIFARAVFDTKGRLLDLPSLMQILSQDDPVLVRRTIERAAASQEEGRP
ncbi:protein of unknown function [Duganella sp. CF458]|nr:protein of unknown function [Duganella sp. CF458]